MRFHTGSLKSNIFKVLFWEGGREGGGHEKEYYVYALDNLWTTPKLRRCKDHIHTYKEVDEPLLKNMLSDAERARGLTGDESGVVNGDIPWTRDVPTRNLTGEG